MASRPGHQVGDPGLREFNDTAGRLESLLPDEFRFFAGMPHFHVDLPIGRVQEPGHLTASRQRFLPLGGGL